MYVHIGPILYTCMHLQTSSLSLHWRDNLCMCFSTTLLSAFNVCYMQCRAARLSAASCVVRLGRVQRRYMRSVCNVVVYVNRKWDCVNPQMG